LGFRQSAIFKLTPVGGGQWTESVVNPVSGPADGSFFYDGVVIDRFENLHGATVHGGETDDGCVTSSRLETTTTSEIHSVLVESQKISICNLV